MAELSEAMRKKAQKMFEDMSSEMQDMGEDVSCGPCEPRAEKYYPSVMVPHPDGEENYSKMPGDMVMMLALAEVESVNKEGCYIRIKKAAILEDEDYAGEKE